MDFLFSQVSPFDIFIVQDCECFIRKLVKRRIKNLKDFFEFRLFPWSDGSSKLCER